MPLLRLLKSYTAYLTPSGSPLLRWRDAVLRRCGLRLTSEPLRLITDRKLSYGSLLPLAVSNALHDNPALTFLQVGAYDGAAHNDLYGVIDRHNLRGVMVEPHPSAFGRLQSVYGDRPGLTLLNAAIDRRSGSRELFSPPQADTRLAAFDPAHTMRAGFARGELQVHRVECLTVADALRRAGLTGVDLLHINASGHDHEILAGVDLEHLRPTLIRFDHRSLPAADVEASLARLARHGYRFLAEPTSVIAISTRRQAAAALRLAA